MIENVHMIYLTKGKVNSQKKNVLNEQTKNCIFFCEKLNLD